jgi:microcystin-dependent protein
MAQPFVGEIRMFGGNFAPVGWAFCNGATIPISENDTLFQLIGTTYGGDGQETFKLPDLQGRLPVHQGQGPGISQSYLLGEAAGVESVTLTTQQIPVHTHAFQATNNQASSFAPLNQVPGVTQLATTTPYGTDNPLVSLASNALQPIGGSQPHDNMQPYLCVSFIISLFGIFPQPN